MSIETALQSLFIAGLTRLGPVAFRKVARLRKIDAAITGAKVHDPAIKQAVNDFEVLIGSWYGELTESLSIFLRDLETSGLITAIAQEALVGRRTESTKLAFAKLHRTIFGDGSGNLDELFERIMTSFETSLQFMSSDPALSLLVRTVSKDLDARLDNIDQRLGELTLGPDPIISYELMSQTYQKMIRALMSQYRYVRIETNKGAKLIDIQRIYIPSKLSYRRPSDIGAEFLQLSMELDKRARAGMIARDARSANQLSYSDFQSGFRRAVVLGDPGGGKSTLCQYLCHQMAKQASLQSQFPAENARFEAQSLRLPIRVVIRKFESAKAASPQTGILDYIITDLRSAGCGSTEEISQTLNHELTYGGAVLAFDGLDEILSTSSRRDFVQLVTAFCDQYPLCPVVVTSRVVGYEDATLTPDFEELLLEKFDEDEVRQYAKNFFKVFANLTAAEAAEDAEKFVVQTSRSASDLRQNPLLLGLMCVLFANKGDVPTNRPEIYQECAVLMFERWDQNRDIRADIPAGFDLLHLFSQLASQIYGQPELEAGVSERWIETANKRFCASMFENQAKVNDAAKKVTLFVKGRSWVMSEIGSDVYGFTHRTFMEYFFARNLDEQHETVSDLLRILRPKFLNNEWNVIAHLALQMKTFRNQRRTSQALHEITAMLKTAGRLGQKRHALYEFVAGTLQYLHGTEVDLRAVTTVLFEELQRHDRKYEHGRALLMRCCNCVPDRQDFVRQQMVKLVTATCIHADRDLNTFGYFLTSDMEHLNKIFPSSGTENVLPAEVRLAVRRSVKANLLQKARSDPFCAAIYWEWYQIGFEDLFRAHNFQMLLIDRRPLSDENAFIALPLQFLVNMHPHIPHTYGQDGNAAATLRTMGEIGFPPGVLNLYIDYPSRQFFAHLNWLVHILRRDRMRPDRNLLKGYLMCLLVYSLSSGGRPGMVSSTS